MPSFLEAAAATIRAAGDDRPPAAGGREATLLLAAAIAVLIGMRIYLALATDFPIGDGALFYEFVRATGETFPGLPETVRYNQMDVPFAYPPWSFWLGGLLANLGIAPLATVHYLPILVNGAYALLFALLMLRGGHSRLFTAIALLFFAASFRSFEWLVMGGGLSRGMGSLFTLLALIACTTPGTLVGRRTEAPLSIWSAVAAGAFVAGAILSHLEWGLLAAASVALSRACGAGSVREFIRTTFMAGLTALLLISPWLFFILQVHGLGPFLAAGGSGGWSIRGSMTYFLVLAYSSLFNPFLPLGGLVLLLRRSLFWIGFTLLCIFLTPRHGATPLVLAVSVYSAAGALALWHLLRQLTSKARLSAAVTAAAVVAVASLMAYAGFNSARYFWPLSAEKRQAMQWVRENHPGASFAVVGGAPWQNDISGEWFPTLSGASSVTTVQGREWLPDRAYARWDEMSKALGSSRSCEEVLTRLAPFGQAEFIWAEWMHDCFADRRFQLVHRNGPVAIFRVARP